MTKIFPFPWEDLELLYFFFCFILKPIFEINKFRSHFIAALRRLRASNQIEEDVEEMRAEERAEHAEAAVSMLELMCSPTLRYPLIIGVVMQLSQQLSGINAVSIFI